MPPDTPTPENAWTIGNLLAWTKGHFEKCGVESPRLCAELLLAKAMELKRIELYTRVDQSPSPTQRAAFREMVKAAAAQKPIAYLIGAKEFYSLDYQVTPDVLIPRPETELLVERSLAWCKEHPQERINLLDIGTGSGCIAITVTKRQPTVYAVATDVSEAALAVAAENARRHGVERVRFLLADLLDLPPDAVPTGGYDIVLSNPPYVAEADRAALPSNVRDYEPAIALFAGGDGLDCYRRLAAGVHGILKVGGLLAVEVGHQQAQAVHDLFTANGMLEPVGRYKDAGGIERALAFTLRP